MIPARPIIVAGHRLAMLERIPVVGAVIGLERSSSYRASADWPLVGPPKSRRVVVPRLLDALGIPYSIVTDSGEAQDVNCDD